MAQYFNLVPQEFIEKNELTYKIENNLINSDTYQSLSSEEKNKVKEILFEMYSQPISTPQALSAIEFTLFGLAKLFFQMNLDTSNLSSGELEFYEMFKEYIQQHEITLNKNDWYIPYAKDKMSKTLINREEYKCKKNDITGSF